MFVLSNVLGEGSGGTILEDHDGEAVFAVAAVTALFLRWLAELCMFDTDRRALFQLQVMFGKCFHKRYVLLVFA